MAVILFLLLTSVSVGYFLRVMVRRLGPITASQTTFPSDQIGRRLLRVFTEVFLQSRVIQERPVAGTLHALVMWGFCVFAWVTVEHSRQVFTGLENAVGNESWYGFFAAVWAAAVLLGITGLSFRRFILRPASLGSVAVSSGVISLLIAGLMVTYLAGWRGWLPGSIGWKVNWWLHTGCFLSMLFAIPNSKHLHLLLAPFTIFARSDTISATRALREHDEDFGMLEFKHLSQKDILDLNACVECGRCTEQCPVNVMGGSLDPKKIILQMQQGWRQGGETVAGTPEEISDGIAWVSEIDLYQCLSCGACEEACPIGIEHVGAKILDLRRGLASTGRIQSDKLTDLFNVMERVPHNPLGLSQDVRTKFVTNAKLPIFDGSQEWLFWLGCGNSYDAHGHEVVCAMRKLLDAAGVSWGILERETCCGEPARQAGNEYLFMNLSEKVIDVLQLKCVKQIMTCDPHCARVFDVDYRQNTTYQNLGIGVWHHTELLDELRPRLPLKPASHTLTFHDPCYLARGRGITAQPRSLLQAAGAQLHQPEQTGKRTSCCGAGGAQLYLADDRVKSGHNRVNSQRFEQLASTGATTIAVACPYCPIMLQDAAHAAGREDMRIADVAEILAEQL